MYIQFSAVSLIHLLFGNITRFCPFPLNISQCFLLFSLYTLNSQINKTTEASLCNVIVFWDARFRLQAAWRIKRFFIFFNYYTTNHFLLLFSAVNTQQQTGFVFRRWQWSRPSTWAADVTCLQLQTAGQLSLRRARVRAQLSNGDKRVDGSVHLFIQSFTESVSEWVSPWLHWHAAAAESETSPACSHIRRVGIKMTIMQLCCHLVAACISPGAGWF